MSPLKHAYEVCDCERGYFRSSQLQPTIFYKRHRKRWSERILMGWLIFLYNRRSILGVAAWGSNFFVNNTMSENTALDAFERTSALRTLGSQELAAIASSFRGRSCFFSPATYCHDGSNSWANSLFNLIVRTWRRACWLLFQVGVVEVGKCISFLIQTYISVCSAVHFLQSF